MVWPLEPVALIGVAYATAIAGDNVGPNAKKDAPGTIGALIASYFKSDNFRMLGEGSQRDVFETDEEIAHHDHRIAR